MSTVSISPRSLRIEEDVWDPAMKRAKNLGVSMTFLIKNYLRQFASSNDSLVIFDEGVVDASSEMQESAENLMKIAKEKLESRLLSPQK